MRACVVIDSLPGQHTHCMRVLLLHVLCCCCMTPHVLTVSQCTHLYAAMGESVRLIAAREWDAHSTSFDGTYLYAAIGEAFTAPNLSKNGPTGPAQCPG